MQAVQQGGWIEPPESTVHRLRDALQLKLPYLTPNASNWKEHRAVHLLAHAEAREQGKKLHTWEEEVLAARNVRDTWPGSPATFPPKPLEGERMARASEAAELLEQAGLDGRDLGARGRVFRKASWGRVPSAVLSIVLFAVLLPFSITSLGLQITLGRLLGDSTDEGLDARTSFQFLAAFFGSLLIWPVVAGLWTVLVYLNHEALASALRLSSSWLEVGGASPLLGLGMVYIACFPLFWASGKSFASAWDVWVDTRKAWTRFRFPAEEKTRLGRLLDEITL